MSYTSGYVWDSMGNLYEMNEKRADSVLSCQLFIYLKTTCPKVISFALFIRRLL